jgi:hypothetical protein
MASSIVHETLEKVLARTTAALVADVEKVGPAQRAGIWMEIELKVKPVRRIFGGLNDDTKSFSCRYSEGLPHERGDEMVSPLVSGSGTEFDLKKGERVILLLSGAATDKPRSLLRAEPLSSLNRISTRQPAR